MTPSLRPLLRDIGIYGIGDLIAKGAAFLMIPIYTRALSIEAFAQWSLVLTLLGILNIFLLLGVDAGFSIHFLQAKTEADRRRLTSTFLLFIASWSALLLALVLPLARPASAWLLHDTSLWPVIAIAAASAPLSLVNTACAQVLRNRFRAKTFVALNAAGALVLVVSTLIALFVLDWGLAGVALAIAVSQLALLPVRLFIVRDHLSLAFSRDALRSFLSFGLPLLPAALAYWVFAGSDRFLLASLSTLEQVALFSAAFSIVAVLGVFNSAWGQAWSPHAVKVHADDPTRAPTYYGRVLTYVVLVFSALAVVLAAFGREVLLLVAGAPYATAAVAVAPLSLGVLAMAVAQVTAAGISLSKRTWKLAALTWVAAILNVAMNFALIPAYGMIAAAWSTAAAYMFLAVAYAVVSHPTMPIVYEARRLATIGGLVAASILALALVPALSVSLATKALLVLAFMLALALFGAVDAREWSAARQFLSRARTSTTDDAAGMVR